MEMRKKASENPDQTPPTVMITGPKHVGKTSLAKILCNYAVREASQVVFVDLDVNTVSIYFKKQIELTLEFLELCVSGMRFNDQCGTVC